VAVIIVIIISLLQALFASSSLSAANVVCNQTSQTLTLAARIFATLSFRLNKLTAKIAIVVVAAAATTTTTTTVVLVVSYLLLLLLKSQSSRPRLQTQRPAL